MSARTEFALREHVDAPIWNARVLRMNGPMQLTTEWAEFTRIREGVRPLYFTSDGDNSTPCTIVYLAESNRWPLTRWPSASTHCIPIAPDRAGALRALEKALRARGCIQIHLDSFAFDAAQPMSLAVLGYEDRERIEFVLPLSEGPEAAWSGFRPTLRNDLRRFGRGTVVCRVRDDDALIGELTEIERDTAARHMAQGKEAGAMSTHTLTLIREALVASGRARIYLAEQDGRALASAVVGRCGAKAYYLYGGARPEGLAVNAPKGLLWHAIRTEFESGVREFNLGGMSIDARRPDSLDHGLYKFKSGFGASERVCVSGTKVLRPMIARGRERLRNLVSGTFVRAHAADNAP